MYTHTQTHTHIHISIHISYIPTYTHMMYKLLRGHIHTYIHVFTNALVPLGSIDSCVLVQADGIPVACGARNGERAVLALHTHIHIHAHIHTYIHTYIQRHTEWLLFPTRNGARGCSGLSYIFTETIVA